MAGAVLLDLDRTLVDLQSFTDYASAWEQVRGRVDVPVGSVPATDWDRPTHACMSALVALAGSPAWHEVSTLIAGFERRAIGESVAMPTLGEAVNAWQGHPVAVITLLPTDVAREVLAHHGIDLDTIIGRDPSIRPKPHGDGLLKACAVLGASPRDSTMIGDATWDQAAAADAGAAFIGVPFTGSAFPPGTATAASLAEAVRRAVA